MINFNFEGEDWTAQYESYPKLSNFLKNNPNLSVLWAFKEFYWWSFSWLISRVIIYHLKQQFSKCHIFDKYLSIFKKSDSFGKLSHCTIKFSHYFFKSIRILQRYKGFCEEHFLKSLEIKYFVSNFQHAITWLNLGQISKSWVVLDSSPRAL